MFYLFKNSSLSQLSQLDCNSCPELNSYQVRLYWQRWQWKIASNKAIDSVLAWYHWHCIYPQQARVGQCYNTQHSGGKLSSCGQTKTFFKKLPLKISSEGQELWLLTISIGVPPVKRQTRTDLKTELDIISDSVLGRLGLFLPRMFSDLIERESGCVGRTPLSTSLTQ